MFKKKKDENRCLWRQADRHTQDKGRGVASIFFSCKICWNCLGSDFFQEEKKNGLNCHSFNFFKLLNSSLKTKTELYNSLFCAVVVCLTSFFRISIDKCSVNVSIKHVSLTLFFLRANFIRTPG